MTTRRPVHDGALHLPCRKRGDRLRREKRHSTSLASFPGLGGWGAEYEERCVSGTADAIQRVLKRLEYEPDAVEISRQLEARIEDMKQGELFAREG
jgi:hypothetical protein